MSSANGSAHFTDAHAKVAGQIRGRLTLADAATVFVCGIAQLQTRERRLRADVTPCTGTLLSPSTGTRLDAARGAIRTHDPARGRGIFARALSLTLQVRRTRVDLLEIAIVGDHAYRHPHRAAEGDGLLE